jgi:hypothetical protein
MPGWNLRPVPCIILLLLDDSAVASLPHAWHDVHMYMCV